MIKPGPVVAPVAVPARWVAERYPEFAQWAVARHGPLPELIDRETYERLRAEYEVSE